jgi:hypothetical protein
MQAPAIHKAAWLLKASGRNRLGIECADIFNEAGRAVWLSGFAHIAAMQNKPVMRMLPELAGDDGFQPALDIKRRLAGSQSGAVCDPENMGINGHCGLAEKDIQHDICCFPPYAR